MFRIEVQETGNSPQRRRERRDDAEIMKGSTKKTSIIFAFLCVLCASAVKFSLCSTPILNTYPITHFCEDRSLMV